MPDCVIGRRGWWSSLMKMKIMAAAAVVVVVSGQPQEKASEALLRFKSALANTDPALANWNASTAPCSGNRGNWAGVLCFNGYVWGLQLENMGLQGQIDVDSLTGMRYLRTLSFSNNRFQGAMPDWRKLPSLRSLYLDGNHFSGQIANDAFAGMPSLTKVYLSNNKFTGPIPASLASPIVAEVALDNNQFSGAIPAVESHNLKLFNVSNNQLQGPVPPSLLRMDPSSFSGNKALCGRPGGPSCDPPKPPPELEPVLHPSPPGTPPADADADAAPAAAALPANNNHRKPPPSAARIVIITLTVLLGLFLVLLLLLLCWRMRSRGSVTPRQGFESEIVSPYREIEKRTPLPMAAASSPREPQQQQQQASKLSFVKDDRQKFDLQDLMRASAEVLGCGNFGASYKAVLVDGEALVVKRFKQMNNIGKEDFHEHMRRLGRLKHPNLLPLVAYLYRKEEKLLVFDFVSNTSLAKHLHDDGKRPEDWPKPLNWGCRLKIIKGVGKGLAYLYAELPSLNVPHGHLKSSNVLIDNNYNALLMDYTLGPVVNPTQISEALVAYKCPEFARSGRTSKKTDVWCLGILILETLTGRPVNKHYDTDLAGWANAILHEASTKGPSHVFDKQMEISTDASRLEMQKLLQIGIACCREDLDRRLDLDSALRKIDQLQE